MKSKLLQNAKCILRPSKKIFKQVNIFFGKHFYSWLYLFSYRYISIEGKSPTIQPIQIIMPYIRQLQLQRYLSPQVWAMTTVASSASAATGTAASWRSPSWAPTTCSPTSSQTAPRTTTSTNSGSARDCACSINLMRWVEVSYLYWF